ncbi:hypothetical protein D3C72_2196800 [compost metagenome]
MPRRSSSLPSLLETTAGDNPRSRAAADMLPVVTTRAKISISARLLIMIVLNPPWQIYAHG